MKKTIKEFPGKTPLKELADQFGQAVVDNLNYNVLIGSLSHGESITSEQVIILFNLSRKRNSNIEEDIRTYEDPL